MFFILLFNSLLALAELTAAFQSRPILLKHKSLYASFDFFLFKLIQLTCTARSIARLLMLSLRPWWMSPWCSSKLSYST